MSPKLQIASGLAILVAISACAYVTAFLLRFDAQLPADYADLLAASLGWVLFIKTAVILHARLHKEYTRYVTFHDMLTIARTVTLSSIGITLVDAWLLSSVTIPRSVIMLDWGCSLVLLAAARTVPRLVRDNAWRSFTSTSGTPALIVGANDAGEALLRTIRHSPELNYRPIGFVDDQLASQGRRIAGIPVLGTYADIANLAAEHNIG